jgi:hypothetical protein
MMTDDEVRHQERTSNPPRRSSTSLGNSPFSNVFSVVVTNKEKYSNRRPSTASSTGPPVPPRNPARNRRPATSGGVTRQPHDERSRGLFGVPPTTPFSVATGSDSQKPSKASSKSPKAEPSGGRSGGAQPLSVTGWQRRSSHDLSRPPHNSVPWTSSPPTPTTAGTSKKRRPTTSSGVITTLKQTNLTEAEKRDLTGAALQATTMTKPYFVTKNGKRHHTFSSKRAPYPRNYERESLDQ